MNQLHHESKMDWIVWYSVVSALGNALIISWISDLRIGGGGWFVISAIPLAIEAIVVSSKKHENSFRNTAALAGVLFVGSYALFLALTVGAISLFKAWFQSQLGSSL